MVMRGGEPATTMVVGGGMDMGGGTAGLASRPLFWGGGYFSVKHYEFESFNRKYVTIQYKDIVTLIFAS